jgi:hypothetical protein
LDVETYLDGTNQSFPYQNAISYKAYGKDHLEESGNNSFKALIESYLKEGYHSDSFITCDRDMNLMDGNHRMGVHIHEGIETVNVRRVKRKIPFQYSVDWYYDVGLSSEMIERVLQRYIIIQQWLIENGMTFCAFLQGDDSEALARDMEHLCHVLKKYDVDKERGRLVLFSMPNPSYSIKNGELFSNRASEVERILRKRATSNDSIIVSKNCLEGQQLFNAYIKNRL